MLHQLMDPRGEYLENCRCADMQLNIFKYSCSISKKVVPNLSIDKEISLWGNRMVLCGVIYHEGEQSYCRHYTLVVKVDNACFLISDIRILRKQKLQCS